MNLQSIHVKDIVKCDVKGRIFYASVLEKERGRLGVFPITPNVNYFEVTAQQVIEHYRKSKASL